LPYPPGEQNNGNRCQVIFGENNGGDWLVNCLKRNCEFHLKKTNPWSNNGGRRNQSFSGKTPAEMYWGEEVAKMAV
jgi:hypothetical protein